MEKSALILTDIQNDFLPGGTLAVAEGNKIVPIANKLQDYFSIIVALQDWHPANHKSFASNNKGYNCGDIINLDGISQVLWPDHCIQNTYGAEFSPELHLKENVTIIQKGTNPLIDSYSGFFDNEHLQATKLKDFLDSKEVNTVYVMGLATDYCVKNTVIDSCKLGYKTYVIEDGCRGVNINRQDSTNAFNEMQSFGAVMTSSAQIINTKLYF